MRRQRRRPARNACSHVDGIQIRLKPPTEAGRLHPRYEKEVDILVAKNKIVQGYPYGVNVDGRDGTLVLDIAESRVLAGFELVAPRQRRWKNMKSIDKPRVTRRADLEFPQETLKHQQFALPLRVITNDNRSLAQIWFGSPTDMTKAIGLSESCIAFIGGDVLLGFHVDISQFRWW